ncbi:MAG: tyrosine--tRNA ligase [Patescibacteria group bacterium]|nr:tyrosine--tRNA ligase [Patescibacteria group bacterium]
MENKMEKSDKIQELLTRGVEEIIDKNNLEKKLRSGKKLRIKLGIDPTSPNIHLGRSIPLLKLRDFQELGHQIVLIIGDFTGLIGDTSDKDSERPMLTQEIVNNNLKTYINQAAKIINIDQAEIHHNSEWLGELRYMDIGQQANAFSLNEFISRDNINRRLTAGKRVSLRELLYPLMQGYDSVEVKADVEIGGTDQRFNLLAGRDLQRLYKQEPQDILTNPLVEGLDGRKMSSSYGNSVNLLDSSEDMFGKIMSLSDEFIIKYFTLLTRVDLGVIKQYEKDLQAGVNPRDIKMKLAWEIVQMYHSEKDANHAQENFIQKFQKKEAPSDLLEISVGGEEALINILKNCLPKKSGSDLRRLLEQGGIKIGEETKKDGQEKIIVPTEGLVLKAGKKDWFKIIK